MNKVTITDGNVMYNFLIDRCKYLLGNNSIEKHKIKQLIISGGIYEKAIIG